ncbi:hypothetical protein ES705_47224 [subsurface metagenome]
MGVTGYLKEGAVSGHDAALKVLFYQSDFVIKIAGKRDRVYNKKKPAR